METLLEKRLINVEEYHKMAEVGILGRQDNVELINGEIIKMSPVGSRHAYTVNLLNELLVKASENTYMVSIQNPVQLHDFSEPEPDVAVLKPNPDKYKRHHPGPSDILLIIEVATSSLNYDMEVKKELYAKANIPEYWLVDWKMMYSTSFCILIVEATLKRSVVGMENV